MRVEVEARARGALRQLGFRNGREGDAYLCAFVCLCVDSGVGTAVRPRIAQGTDCAQQLAGTCTCQSSAILARPQEGEPGQTSADARRLRDVCARVGCMANERPRTAWSTKHLEQDLSKLLKVGKAGLSDGPSVAACSPTNPHPPTLPFLDVHPRTVQSQSVEQHRDVLERPAACAALSALVAFCDLLSEVRGMLRAFGGS